MIGKTIALAFLTVLIFAFEQVTGLPLLFFAMVLWFSHVQPPIPRQMLLCLAGLIIGLAYHVPLAGGWLLLLVLAGLWNVSQSWLKNDTARLLLLSICGAGAVAVASRFEWTNTAVVSVGVSLILTYIFSRTVFFISTNPGKLRLNPSLRLVRTEKI